MNYRSLLSNDDTGSGNILSFLLPLFSRKAVVSYWRKNVHEVLVNRLGGLSLPRKSVIRLTDRPDMTLDVYRGRKTTIQQQLSNDIAKNSSSPNSYIFLAFMQIHIRRLGVGKGSSDHNRQPFFITLTTFQVLENPFHV